MRKISGFTMIELLIVIAIVGVLATIGIALVNPAGQFAKARDTQRKNALKQIQTALQDYYNDNGKYPLTNGTSNAYDANGTPDVNWIPGLVPNYIPKLPMPPNVGTCNTGGNQWEATECYIYWYRVFDSGQSYVLQTRLENGNDPEACKTKAYSTQYDTSGNLVTGVAESIVPELNYYCPTTSQYRNFYFVYSQNLPKVR